MKISTKGRYALRLMLDLAINNTGEFVPLKLVSERQDISVKYLEQIITTLVKAGFVKGLRGSKGGYKLAKSPGEYTVGMILRLTEGSLAPVACLEDEINTCERCEDCITLELWKDLYSAINSVVDNVTLADLIERFNAKIGNDYSI
ncbi:MAG: Rrf2 family transcriptional regulator [Clostridia bacterium]|nr:Rrf2 family transcriptional regulator [Clostridia bacterium]